MDLPLSRTHRYGFSLSFPHLDDGRDVVRRADAEGWDAIWLSDHVEFTEPMLDPLVQLAHLGACSERLRFGTAVYLLPLRHPVHVAKQVATLDRLLAGRFDFGVGVGGEFAGEFEACGVPVTERGARMDEALPLLRQLWSGEPVRHAGRFYPQRETRLQPLPRQTGGPPIFTGGRSEAALRRAGRLADGWISYVVTPAQYRDALAKIAAEAERAQREIARFETGHLIFLALGASREQALDQAAATLSCRYAMDFRRAAERYAALGTPADVAAQIDAFQRAGMRNLIVDAVGRPEEREEQLSRFAREVRPLLG
jgi:probable F420-dependent oxidoreductase